MHGRRSGRPRGASDRILTVSEASKSDILRCFNVPADKIIVTYNAIDERFRVEPRPRSMSSARASGIS